MNSLGIPTCLDDLHCVQHWPALRLPMAEGGFEPSWLPSSKVDASSQAEEVARYRVPGSRGSYVYKVRPCESDSRWYAWGDWCPYGRTATDACYDFLDGGGSFANRSAAEWAIHTFVAALCAAEHANLPKSYAA
ncbi:hypothetical protein [Phragmitibacter flavus]|uniref:hypothetical protein n=1 Tax=Phragmitibacter flavus TaxID=2576071 RepID=UPI0014077FA9|nr:hypothetical protein [Phragmitibacter flavus]